MNKVFGIFYAQQFPLEISTGFVLVNIKILGIRVEIWSQFHEVNCTAALAGLFDPSFNFL
jgi:hypothetical protein